MAQALQDPLLLTSELAEPPRRTGWRIAVFVLALASTLGAVTFIIPMAGTALDEKATGKYHPDEALKMMHLTAASYYRKPQECLKAFPDTAAYEVIHDEVTLCPAGLFNDKTTQCIAYAACKKNLFGKCEHVVLSYRGTTKFNQLRGEFGACRDMSDFRGAKVGSYWLTMFHQLNATYNAVLAEASKGARVTVVGHSLGGAVASVASAELAARLNSAQGGGSQVSLYTFGQPRAGNCAFAHLHDTLVPDSFRVVNSVDLVPHLPECKSTGVFTNHGCKCDMDPSNTLWYHHGTEIWYNSAGQMRVCTGEPKDEDITCSDSEYMHFFSQVQHLARGIYDHLHYFGVDVGSICRQTLQGP